MKAGGGFLPDSNSYEKVLKNIRPWRSFASLLRGFFHCGLPG